MHVVLLMSAMLSAPAIAPQPTGVPRSPPRRCASGPGLTEYRADAGLAAHPLDREPPAALLLGLYRVVDGCPTPVVLRRGLGSETDAAPPRIRGGANLHSLSSAPAVGRGGRFADTAGDRADLNVEPAIARHRVERFQIGGIGEGQAGGRPAVEQ